MKSKIVSVVAAVAALVGVSSVASAQDGRRFNWSGVYFGAGIGNVSTKTNWSYINNGGDLSQSSSDAAIALHAGYQHQFMGGLVIGAEMGYGRTLGANFGSATCPNPSPRAAASSPWASSSTAPATSSARRSPRSSTGSPRTPAWTSGTAPPDRSPRAAPPPCRGAGPSTPARPDHLYTREDPAS